MQNAFSFRLMALEFRIRDLFHPPINLLRKIGIREGMTVLDFGCGPGGFSIAAGQLVGNEGKVWALDIHPQALESTRRRAAGRGLDQINVIDGSNFSQIDSKSVDIVLLYDLLHHLSDSEGLLKKIAATLKGDGILSITDHHLPFESILRVVSSSGLFRLSGTIDRAAQFSLDVA